METGFGQFIFLSATQTKYRNSNAVFSQQQHFRETVHQHNVVQINAKQLHL